MIEIEGLSKTFGSLHAVRDLSLSIPRGELFCFLGPNGAGKTTTLKMLCGLMHPTSGRVLLNGMDIQKEPDSLRGRIGYIPDTPYLYELLTPTEFLEFLGDLYDIPRGDVNAKRDSFFRAFGMQEHAHTLVKHLSHGFRQRLIYAAAFLHDPEILLVDEPFVGLDPFSIRMIREMLREKACGGMTIFLTTHILAFAENLADRIGIIAEGRLAAVGTMESLNAQSAVQGTLEDIFMSLTRAEDAGAK